MECQVYYHIGDYRQTNWVPKLMRRLAQVILSPSCDHSVLLDYHPRLVHSYQKCLQDLKCTEHTFSSDGNVIGVRVHEIRKRRVTYFEFRISFMVAIFWESGYHRGLAAAHKRFNQ